jgi:hypothetical protein
MWGGAGSLEISICLVLDPYVMIGLFVCRRRLCFSHFLSLCRFSLLYFVLFHSSYSSSNAIFQKQTQPFITDLTAVGRAAKSGNAFIPDAYEPSTTDIKVVGACGMMGILGYGVGSFV